MKTLPLALFLLAAGVIHAAQPNIVFVLFDDMGWTQPQSYDANSALRTPHLDRLATRGALNTGSACYTLAHVVTRTSVCRRIR